MGGIKIYERAEGMKTSGENIPGKRKASMGNAKHVFSSVSLVEATVENTL